MASATYAESRVAAASDTAGELQSPVVSGSPGRPSSPAWSWRSPSSSCSACLAPASAWAGGPGRAHAEAGSFGIGAGLWWLVSNLLALVAGGYVAAWLAGNTLRFDGVLHGVVTWGITLLLTF